MQRRHFGLAGRAAGALAFLVTAALAQPALAGDSSELDCAVAGLSQADRATLLDGIGRGEAAARNNAAVPVAAEIVSACRDRFDWNSEEHRAASHYVPAFLAKQRFRAMLEGEQGLDLAAIERMVIADTALIAAAVAMRRDPPELMAFMRRLDPSVSAWAQRRSGNRELLIAFGGFIAATALVEGMRVRFAQS